MTFVVATIEDALYDWAYGVSGKEVIWAYANAPSPALPYITLRMTNFKKVNWDAQTQTNDEGKAALFGNREFTLEVNYYGSGSLDIMEKLTTSLQQPSICDAFEAKGLHFFDKISQTNITEVMGNAFEERYMMELGFRVSNQGITDPDTFDTGIIQTVEVEGETEAGENTLESDLDIGVPYEPPEEEEEEPPPEEEP